MCERARFSVAEVVQLTLDLYRRNCIEGLFLSSGIARNEDDTMADLVRGGEGAAHRAWLSRLYPFEDHSWRRARI